MDANRLNQQLIILVNSMFQEGFLDEQFTQLQMLQDASNPGFVADVISLFSEDSERLLAELTTTLEQDPIDFRKVDAYVHQFKGSSSSIGAHRVKLVCIDFRAFCEGGNREGCQQALQQVKQEFYLLKSKLEIMLQLMKEQPWVPFCCTKKWRLSPRRNSIHSWNRKYMLLGVLSQSNNVWIPSKKISETTLQACNSIVNAEFSIRYTGTN